MILKLFSLLKRKRRPEEEFKLITKSYINLAKTKEEKIQLEKRRRNQAYTTLNYVLSLTSYFDFFSLDTFLLLKNSKAFAYIYQKDAINSEVLLFSILMGNIEVSYILNDFLANKADGDIALKFTNLPKKTTRRFAKKILRKSFSLKNKAANKTKVSMEKIKFSYETNLLFEKAAENAMSRFKTPVITPEILLITIMEERRTRAGKLIEKKLKNETQWYLLRYKLLQIIHNHESTIRSEVKRNQQYFAYLFQTQLTNYAFEKMIEEETFADAVLIFRDTLILQTLKMDLYDLLENDIYTSISINSNRTYSS